MDIEVGPLGDDELDELILADLRGFSAGEVPRDLDRRVREGLELDRFLVARDDGRIVGNIGAFSMELTVPGGARVPVCAVTWVAVAATHRRRGLMRRLIELIHDEALRRREVAAVLWAAEASIYPNVGYGPTHQIREVAIDTRVARLREDAPSGGRLRYIDPTEVVAVQRELQERLCAVQIGELGRSEQWWRRISLDFEHTEPNVFAPYAAVHVDDDGMVDGIVTYRSTECWDESRPNHRVEVREFIATTPTARSELIGLLLSLDLVGEVRLEIGIDDPLDWMLVDPRAARTTWVADSLWLRVLDVEGLFGPRTYGDADPVVVDAGELGTWRLGESPARTSAPPELSLGVGELGALSLGGVSATTLVRAGRVLEHRPGAARRLDALLRSDPPPLCLTHF